MKQAYTEIDSPVGRLLLAGEPGCLRALLFGEGPKRATPQEDWVADAVPFRPVIDQLNAYFAGELREFSVTSIPRAPRSNCGCGGSSARIPYGETISYGQLATRIGNPKASRAVGWRTGRIRFRSSSRAIA